MEYHTVFLAETSAPGHEANPQPFLHSPTGSALQPGRAGAPVPGHCSTAGPGGTEFCARSSATQLLFSEAVTFQVPSPRRGILAAVLSCTWVAMAACAARRCCCSCLLPRAFNSDGSWPRAGEDAGTTPALQVLPYPATRLWFLHCKLNSPWLMCKLISNKNHGGYQFCRTCYIMLRKPFLPVQFLIKR